MRAATDWESMAGALPVLLWILFLALRRRKRPPTDVGDDDDPATPPRRARRLRHDESPEFQRNYDPIEPS